MRAVLLAALLAGGLFGQDSPDGSLEQFNHAKWSGSVAQAQVAPGGTVTVKLDAAIDSGWHMYSLTTPPGPIPTTIKAVDSPGVAGLTVFEPPPVRKFDPNFNADTETYEGTQTFYARVTL